MSTDPSGYKSILVRFISYLDNAQYSKETVFEKEKLAQLKPDDLMRFLIGRYFDQKPRRQKRR